MIYEDDKKLDIKVTKEKKFKNFCKKATDFFLSDFMMFIYVVSFMVFVIWVLVSATISCEEKDYPYGDYEMVYRVYYTPTNVRTYTIKHNRPILSSSERGTNYIKKYDGGIVIRTNAPIEVVRYVNHIKSNTNP